jgi:hypothetical protein
LASTSVASKSKKTKQPLTEEVVFKRLGQKWCVMYQPWLNEGNLFGKELPADFRPNDTAQRFASKENENLGLVAELYAITASTYHPRDIHG